MHLGRNSLAIEILSMPPGGAAHVAPFCCDVVPFGMVIFNADGLMHIVEIDPTVTHDITTFPLLEEGSTEDKDSADLGRQKGVAVRNDKERVFAGRIVCVPEYGVAVVACNHLGAGGASACCELRIVSISTGEVVCVCFVGAEERIHSLCLFHTHTNALSGEPEALLCVGTGKEKHKEPRRGNEHSNQQARADDTDKEAENRSAEQTVVLRRRMSSKTFSSLGRGLEGTPGGANRIVLYSISRCCDQWSFACLGGVAAGQVEGLKCVIVGMQQAKDTVRCLVQHGRWLVASAGASVRCSFGLLCVCWWREGA